MPRFVRILATLAVCCWAISGCSPPPQQADPIDKIEQRWTNVSPSQIGPYTCSTPFNPMYQAWPSSGFCQPQPAYYYPVATSPLWRVSSCDAGALARASAEITLSNGTCARLWGAVNPTGTFFDFDLAGAYGWRNTSGTPLTQVVSFRVAHDTFLSFCTGPMSQGNPCQPTNPPNFPESAYPTESGEVSGTLNVLFKTASIHLATW